MKNILDKFRIDNTTYILILLALLSGYIKNVFIILLIVLVHELGHVFFFWLFKIEIESVVIYPFGGISKVNKKLHERIYKDILISLGGILFQLLLYIFFCILFYKGMIVFNTFNIFCTYNLSIILFNLLPIIPLDGSKLFFSVFTKFLSYKKCLVLEIFLGVLSLILFIVYVVDKGLNDFVIIVFLFMHLFKLIREFKYIMNKFYLERILYNNYYDGIISDKCLEDMRIDKYYYFKIGNNYMNEGDYLIKNRF